jgi:hypothetical protein
VPDERSHDSFVNSGMKHIHWHPRYSAAHVHPHFPDGHHRHHH